MSNSILLPKIRVTQKIYGTYLRQILPAPLFAYNLLIVFLNLLVKFFICSHWISTWKILFSNRWILLDWQMTGFELMHYALSSF